MNSLFTRIKPKTKANLRVSTILLDTSGSMYLDDGKGRRIDLLRQAIEILGDLRGIKMLSFNDWVSEVEDAGHIPEPRGCTNMSLAFDKARTFGSHHVLITDGVPDSAAAALQSAHGQVFDIIYIGPEPTPSFLRELARRSSGTLQIGEIRNPKMLADKISGLLEHKT